MSSTTDGYFMSISSTLGSESKSFEETRIDDYIKAYQSTGRPPQPCPQEPTDELQRTSLNLPPLFKPHPIHHPTSAPTTSSTLALDFAARINNPAELPSGQEFCLPSTNGEKYHCISCMSLYANFSLEELRYYAYLVGNIRPPASVLMDPFVKLVQETAAAATAAATPLSNLDDQFQSISTQSQYDKHSHEELRVAFLLFGREMTSAELLQPQSASTIPPTSQPIISIPERSIPPLFAAPTSMPIPKFTFGLR